MLDNYEIYKEKALEACRQVFLGEYNRSIGIPLPNIDFILPVIWIDGRIFRAFDL